MDVEKYRVHAKAQATWVDPSKGERSIDWFLTDATEWPPPMGTVPDDITAGVSGGRLKGTSQDSSAWARKKDPQKGRQDLLSYPHSPIGTRDRYVVHFDLTGS